MFADNITWTRIIALYAFAGGLAVDCVVHGRAIFLGKIVNWLGSFVMRNIAKWIQEQGGWVCPITCLVLYLSSSEL